MWSDWWNRQQQVVFNSQKYKPQPFQTPAVWLVHEAKALERILLLPMCTRSHVDIQLFSGVKNDLLLSLTAHWICRTVWVYVGVELNLGISRYQMVKKNVIGIWSQENGSDHHKRDVFYRKKLCHQFISWLTEIVIL